ncbi:RNA polymerase sigma factor [Nocardia suismassiliense]|uniref:RNA polymerase sigma factor n=1 Tax=Nocardia suismassiliense TaxID=2077092 RepID=A0ABW6R3R2_9NOCA
MSAPTTESLDRWLGRSIIDVPTTLQLAVFEYIVGVGLLEATTYAAHKARYVLNELDPEMCDTYEDIAQDVIVDLTETLPHERIRHWRAVLLQLVKWRVLHLRRKRLTARRHPGRRVDYDTAVSQLDESATADDYERMILRDQLIGALAAIPHEETRAVLAATFVIPTHDMGYDVRTVAEVAQLLGMSESKVKHLRTAGVRILRRLLDPTVRPKQGRGES